MYIVNEYGKMYKMSRYQEEVSQNKNNIFLYFYENG